MRAGLCRLGRHRSWNGYPVGGSGVVTVKYKPPLAAGTYKVRVVADPGNFITENNEIDNKGTRKFGSRRGADA